MMTPNDIGLTPTGAARNNVDDKQVVVSSLFKDAASAQSAIRELHDIGVPAEDISVISRDQSGTEQIGVQHEDLAREDLTYRASDELPNDEDLPTEAAITGQRLPIVTDFEVPPDEP